MPGADWRRLPRFPVFAAAVPTLYVASKNTAEVGILEVLVTAGVCMVVGAAIYALMAAAFRRADSDTVALIALAAVAWVFLSLIVTEELSRALGRVALLERIRFVLPLTVLVCGSIIWRLYAVNRSRPGVVRLMAIGTYLLLFTYTATFAWGEARSHRAAGASWIKPLATSDVVPDSVAARPDIYLIILDGYSNSSVLNEVFSFSNARFEDSLRTLGFVVPATRSNYGHTVYSLASLLNLAHITPLDPAPGVDTLYAAIEHNRAAVSLRNLGYEYHLFPASGFPGTARSALADSTWVPKDVPGWRVAAARSPLATVMLNSTLVGKLAVRFGYGLALPQLDMLAIREMGADHASLKPRFVVAHLMLTHHPYFFDERCSRSRKAMLAERSGKNAYIDQIQCANRLLLDALTRMTERTPKPVILLQADHGSAALRGSAGDGTTPEQLEEQFGAFGAYFLPGTPAAAIGDTVTPVNVLRIVFKNYFDMDLPLLPNDSFVLDRERRRALRLVEFEQEPAEAGLDSAIAEDVTR